MIAPCGFSYFDGNRTVTFCKVIERLHFSMCPNGYILLMRANGVKTSTLDAAIPFAGKLKLGGLMLQKSRAKKRFDR